MRYQLKDLILAGVTLKLQNLDNSLRTAKLLDLYHIKEYGYTMITVNKYHEPFMNLRLNAYDHFVNETPLLDVVRILLNERDTLLRVFPSFKGEIMMGYHYQISKIEVVVVANDDISIVDHLQSIGELDMKEYTKFMSLKSSDRQQLVEASAKPLYDAYMKLHKYDAADVANYVGTGYNYDSYRYLLGNSRGRLLYTMLFNPKTSWQFPYDGGFVYNDYDMLTTSIDDWYNRVIPVLIDLYKRITSEERQTLKEYLIYKRALPRDALIENFYFPNMP